MKRRAAPNNGHTPWTLAEIALLTLFIGLVILFRAYNLKSYDVLSADGTSYGPIGRRFFATGDFRVFGFISGPTYSFFVGLFDLVLHDIERSLRLVSVCFSSLTVATVYCLGRSFTGRPGALAAALLAAFLPFLHGMSGIDITEPTFTFFLLTGTLLFWHGYTAPHRGAAIAGGLLLGIAYLARNEGFITWFALSTFALVDLLARWRRDGKRQLVRVLVPFWIAFSLLFLPYLVYLRSVTGEWHLSGKAAGNAQVIREYRGKTEVDQKFKFKKDGTGFDVAQGEGLGTLLRKDPELFLANLRRNLRELPLALNAAMPWYLLLAALVGFVVTPWSRLGLLARAGIVSICAPLIIYVLFFVQLRGFYPYVTALCVWAGAGLGLAARPVGPGAAQRPWRSWLPMLALVVPLVGWYLYQDFPRPKPPYDVAQDSGRLDEKHVGQRLRTILPKDAVLMTRSGRIAFYAERPMVIPPQAPYDEIIAYARKNRASHLIATMQLLGMRPQLEFLYGPILRPDEPFSPPADLEMLFVGQEEGGLAYIVFRIKPSPTQRNVTQ